MEIHTDAPTRSHEVPRTPLALQGFMRWVYEQCYVQPRLHQPPQRPQGPRIFSLGCGHYIRTSSWGLHDYDADWEDHCRLPGLRWLKEEAVCALTLLGQAMGSCSL